MKHFNQVFLARLLLVFACVSMYSCGWHAMLRRHERGYSFKRMDTLYISPLQLVQRQKNNSLDYNDISLGNMIASDMSKEMIVKNHITAIKSDASILYYDNLGYLTWNSGTGYKYLFDKDTRPVSVYNGQDSIQYIYNGSNKLVKCGQWLINYFPNGFKKSVENYSEIERYEYDMYGNICHINFDLKPHISACGNRTTEWYGRYNKNHNLVKEWYIGSAQLETTYKYSHQGNIIKYVCENEIGRSDGKQKIFYVYNGQTLTFK